MAAAVASQQDAVEVMCQPRLQVHWVLRLETLVLVWAMVTASGPPLRVLPRLH